MMQIVDFNYIPGVKLHNRNLSSPILEINHPIHFK